MKYCMVCNTCGTVFHSKHARYFCDTCRKKQSENEVSTQIKDLLREDKYKGIDIAKKFDVTPSYVSKLKREIGLIKDFEKLL